MTAGRKRTVRTGLAARTTSAAIMPGRAAAPAGLNAKGRHFFNYIFTAAADTYNFGYIRTEKEFFKISPAFITGKFEKRHIFIPRKGSTNL